MPSDLVRHAVEAPSRALGETHRRDTLFPSTRAPLDRSLFQGRFGSTVTDQAHRLCGRRHVALNPAR